MDFARIDEQLLTAEDETDAVESVDAELKPHIVSDGRDILKMGFIDGSCFFLGAPFRQPIGWVV